MRNNSTTPRRQPTNTRIAPIVPDSKRQRPPNRFPSIAISAISKRISAINVAPWQWGLIAAVALLWAYRSSFVELVGRWSNEPEYSHGFFVPVFAIVMLWLRRGQVVGLPWEGSWWGLLLIAVGAAIRFYANYGFYTLLEAWALIPTLFGLAVAAGGRRAFWWSLPSIAFLGFMIPLPGFASEQLAHPLQRVATICSTYLLQLIGISAVANGNVILLTEGKIGVVEACSGLRMLMLFIAVATGFALVVPRRGWEKLLLVASAVPIALFVNILRITSTAIVHELISPKIADAVFHDVAGLLMGPVALGLLWLEIKFLDHSVIELPSGPLALRPTSR